MGAQDLSQRKSDREGTMSTVTTYAVTNEITATLSTSEGAVEITVPAGTYEPQTELEAALLADLALTGVVTPAPAKKKPGAAPESPNQKTPHRRKPAPPHPAGPLWEQETTDTDAVSAATTSPPAPRPPRQTW